MEGTPPITPEKASAAEASSAVGPGMSPTRVSGSRSKTRKLIFLGALALVAVAVGVLLYFHFAAWESTDDAQIDGYIYPVSSRVSGYVTHVAVDDNQYVEAGTVLVQLDPEDYDVAVANAKATLANDHASAAALQINVPITSVNTSSQLSSAQADIDNAQAGLLAAQKS